MFDATTTADEVLAGRDLTNHTAVVTGGTGGIGIETARALAAAGATVVVAGRDPGKLDVAEIEGMRSYFDLVQGVRARL